MSTNQEEYNICETRGHEPEGRKNDKDEVLWMNCKHCGIWYRYSEPTLVESETEPE